MPPDPRVEVPEEFEGLADIADALEEALGGPQFEHDVRVVYVRMLALELPALLAAIRKQERQRVAEVLEAMVKREELNSRDCGWVVPTTSIEAALDTLEDSDD